MFTSEKQENQEATNDNHKLWKTIDANGDIHTIVLVTDTGKAILVHSSRTSILPLGFTLEADPLTSNNYTPYYGKVTLNQE